MSTQSFVWTCLPNGLTPDRRGLRVSVLVSPRLDAQGDPPELATFPEWLDWPQTFRDATLTFFIGGQKIARRSIGSHPGVEGPDPSSDIADSAVWKALFHRKVGVAGYQLNKDILQSEILSHSATDIHDLVRDLYRDLAVRTGRNLPKIGVDLLDNPAWQNVVAAVNAVDEWGQPPRDRRVPNNYHLPYDYVPGRTPIENRFAALGRIRPVGPAGTGSGDVLATAQHLAQFELFHTPPLKPKPSAPSKTDDKRIDVETQEFTQAPMPDKAELAKTLDFHRIVAAMNAYPVLPRRLGLVADFVIDRGTVPMVDDFLLSVQVEFTAGVLTVPRGAADVTAVTHTTHTRDGFFAKPKKHFFDDDTRIKAGLLDLYTTPDRYAVLQADVDGAGLKLMNFARTLGGYQRAVTSDPAAISDDVSRKDKEAGAPALRTGGMMLVQRDRRGALKRRFDANLKQAKDAALGTTELWAEDLTRGYRIDVWDATVGSWRSLCRRNAEYLLNSGALTVTPATGEDETTVQLAATRSPDPTYNAKILYLHEAMVSWTGWSLAVPPPGRSIGRDDNAAVGGKPEFSDEAELPPGLDFRSHFKAVKGSLPRLRYGRRYDLRARAVDLAGNSLPASDDSFGPEDPATAARPFLRFEPVMAPALALLRPAGGTTQIPADGESMYRLAILTRNRKFDDPTPTTVVARRYAVPPQSTVRDAELHGMLDAGGVLNPSMFFMLANDKDRDASDPLAALVNETIARQGPLDLKPVDTTFAVWREGESLTYLPDPMARFVRACFIGHPTMPEDETLRIPLYATGGHWPDARPFRIELFEDAIDKPAFDDVNRVLRIPLGKGDRATLRLSMCLAKGDLHERIGLWQWLDVPAQQDLERDVIEGRHWMFTPWQDVELVHAVQRPLLRPAIERLGTRRDGPGATRAFPFFEAICSLKSTDKLDLRAHWHEPDDDPARGLPVDRSRDDLAFQVKITEARDYKPAKDALPDHALPDPKDPDRIQINTLQRDLLAKKCHEFNDTRYRRIEYRLDATTRYREYLPAELRLEKDAVTGEMRPVDRHLIVEGDSTVTWVNSSAPPPAPQVKSVVPTFAWTRTQAADGTARSWRRGGGLRVYLQRPWNVTGYGEMLAVVLPPVGFAGDPDSSPSGKPYKKYVTQWGNDPIWESPFVAGLAPTRDRFPLARWQPDPAGAWVPAFAPATERDQPPGPFEVSPSPPGPDASGPIEVAPHDVFFDDVRGLWYCDIEIDHGRSYWPFVRLALARYQPGSDPGAYLSDVVLADFMQLTADRWLTVRADGERGRHVTVSGFGYSNSAGAREHADPAAHVDAHGAPLPGVGAPVSSHSVVEVTVEQLDPSLGEDFGWRAVARGEPTPPDPPRRPSLETHAFEAARLSPESVVTARQKIAARDFESLLKDGLAERLSVAPTLWDGRINLPRVETGVKLRIVVAEYEEYAVDDAGPRTGMGRRLVFVEHVELD